MLFAGMIVGLVVLPPGYGPPAIGPVREPGDSGDSTLPELDPNHDKALLLLRQLLLSEQQKRSSVEKELEGARHELEAAQLEAKVARDVLERHRRESVMSGADKQSPVPGA